MPSGIYKRTKLNFKHGMQSTKIYGIWETMKTRCLNKNSKFFKFYGGRGITVCSEWLDFENFYKDMGDRPENKTLDRIKNNLGYFKENCKWSTYKEQANNRRNNRFLTYENKTQTIAQWSRELNINYHTIYCRIKRGWKIKEVLNS